MNSAPTQPVAQSLPSRLHAQPCRLTTTIIRIFIGWDASLVNVNAEIENSVEIRAIDYENSAMLAVVVVGKTCSRDGVLVAHCVWIAPANQASGHRLKSKLTTHH
ncbi:hypothetical protein [Glutamicibacter ardleyensis]|jgi:hypothetical protein|uniref:hypothetical protein n=1 Tax=Glutamicibacter ardleyensis TaxID=225894 RepID=UPI003FD5EB5D